MTNLTTLHDAFVELEKRADAESRAGCTVRPAAPARASRRRPVLIGVTAAALLAAVGGAAVVGGGTDRPSTVVAGGPSESSSSGTSVAVRSPAGPGPVPGAFGLPTSTDALQDRFQAALGDLATFEVTSTSDPSDRPQPSAPVTTGGSGVPELPIPDTAPPAGAPDVMVIGVLTAAGVRGGFDVQTLQTDAGSTAWCATDSLCTVTTQADGSSLAIGTSEIVAADGSANGGTTYVVNLVHRDGSEVLLHLSNQRDPKG